MESGIGPLDLTADVTVFLITVGEKTTRAAREAIVQQDCRFCYDEIIDVAPMSAAFQQMIVRCTTPYYVEVDADMVLKPHAIRLMHQSIELAQHDTPSVAMVAHALWDQHVELPLIGLKIYDHAVFSAAPYRDVQSCEMDQLDRLAGEGWTTQCHLPAVNHSPSNEEIVGSHVTAQTPWQAYERYKDLLEKQRRYGHSPWVEELLRTFLSRLVAHTNTSGDIENVDLWAIFGLIVGCATDVKCSAGEKDARMYERDAVFQRIRSMME